MLKVFLCAKVPSRPLYVFLQVIIHERIILILYSTVLQVVPEDLAQGRLAEVTSEV